MNRSIFDLEVEELEMLLVQAKELLKSKIAAKKATEANTTETNDTTMAMNIEKETEFTAPKKTAKRKKTETVKPIETKNTFSDLEEETTNEETVTIETNTVSTNKKKQRIAPIFLKDKMKWTQVSKIMKTNKINFNKCKMVTTGVQIDPATEDDYRKLNHCLEKEKVQYYTYQLRSEKKLKIVLRGLLQELSEDEIKTDLNNSGYPVEKITRMKNRHQQPIPLVLLEIEREYKSIYDLKYCCDLAITVEPLRTRTGIIQCHKCQLFGHAQRNCHINYKCMKCGDEHSTHECKKPKTTPPKCANCEGEHLSTYIKCSKNPNNPENKKKSTIITAQPPKENAWFKKSEEQGNKKTITEKPAHAPNNKTDDELAKTLGQMLLNFHKTNATQEQKIEFLQHTETIIQIFDRK